MSAGILAASVNLQYSGGDAPDHRRAFRENSLRWHPDKFLHKFGSRLAPDDADLIHQRVMLVAQHINAEWEAHLAQGQDGKGH